MVLDGKVITRNHSLDNPFSYEILSVAKAGSILGVEYLDNGVSTSASAWSIVGSHKANFVEMSRDTFDRIWKVIITREKEIQKQVYCQCRIFNYLSQQTQYRIMYEAGRTVYFGRNQVVCQWHRRSPWNQRG